MTDHEKEILDKIKQSTEKTPVPESLAPDQIMKMLEEHNSTQASGHIPKKHGFSRGHRIYFCSKCIRISLGCRTDFLLYRTWSGRYIHGIFVRKYFQYASSLCRYGSGRS